MAKKSSKKFINKVFISIFSLFLFFLLLELALRLIGSFYSFKKTNLSPLGENSVIKEEIFKKDSEYTKNNYTILCVGDSFTFGGYWALKETYPYYLEKLLNSVGRGNNYRVINAGVCEYNSRQVLIRLPFLLEKYKPNMVIIMVGATERFNLAGYTLFDRGLKSFIHNFRVYKMFKIISLNIKANILDRNTKNLHKRKAGEVGQGFSVEIGVDGYGLKRRENLARGYFDRMGQINHLFPGQPLIERAWYFYNKGDKLAARRLCEEALEAGNKSPEVLCNLAYFLYFSPDFPGNPPPYYSEEGIWEAFKFYNEAFQIAPNSEFVLSNLSLFYNRVSEDYTYRRRYDVAMDFFFKAIELDPNYHELYGELINIFSLQSKYNSEDIIEFLEGLSHKSAEFRENAMIKNYLVFFRDRDKWEKSSDELLKKNLEKIVILCKKKNLETIILNYPDEYTAANKFLQEVASKFSLVFVDNVSRFRDLKLKENWHKYFDYDGDPNALGNQKIAENIFDVIKTYKLSGNPDL